MKKKLKPRFKFVGIGPEYFASVSIIPSSLSAKESFSKILTKTAHEYYAAPAPVTTSPTVRPIIPPTPDVFKPLVPS